MLLFVLLDFSKAFDKVNHSELLLKLHQYGIRGKALSWIRAFLGNRSQTMVLDEESGLVHVSFRVPQGSVLGHILFPVYINDLPAVTPFADDTAVYLTVGGAEDEQVLQNDLKDRLSMWEDRWDMEFKQSKWQVIRMVTARKVINSVRVLEVVTSAKYLGLTILELPHRPHNY